MFTDDHWLEFNRCLKQLEEGGRREQAEVKVREQVRQEWMAKKTQPENFLRINYLSPGIIGYTL